MPNCFAIEDLVPVIDPTAYVHPTAVLIGDVIVGPRCYVGPAACLRGDFGRLTWREGANVQDTCVLQSFPDRDTIIDGRPHRAWRYHSRRTHRAECHGRNERRGDGPLGHGRICDHRRDGVCPGRHGDLAAFAGLGYSCSRSERIVRRGNCLEAQRHREYQQLAVRSLASQRAVEPLSMPQADRPRYRGGSNVTLGALKASCESTD